MPDRSGNINAYKFDCLGCIGLWFQVSGSVKQYTSASNRQARNVANSRKQYTRRKPYRPARYLADYAQKSALPTLTGKALCVGLCGLF